MAQLPQFQSDDQNMQLLQNKWAAILNPIIAKPQNSGNILQSVPLAIGANVINHKLGRNLQGWVIIRQRAAGTAYDTQDTNLTPDLTLRLVSSAVMVCDIWVF